LNSWVSGSFKNDWILILLLGCEFLKGGLLKLIQCSLLVGCALCIFSSALFAQTADTTPIPSSLDIAPLVHHSNRSQSAKRLRVNRFIIDGLVERERYGITLGRLQALIKSKQSVLGYPLTVSEIHHIADHLTRFYHAVGFPFSRVIVPEQEVVDNTIRLQVIEAVIASVDIRGESLYGRGQLQSPFSSIIGKVTNSFNIESLLRHVNSFPGLQTFGYFSKGAKPGETRINLKVQQEESWQLLTKVDNYGTDTTGENRGLVSLTLNNPLGFADQLSVGVLQSFDSKEGDQNTTYGSLSYRTPLFHSALSLGLLASNNQFDIGRDFSDLGLEGEASIARVDMRYQWAKSRTLNSTLAVYGDSKTSDVKSGLTTDILDKDETSDGVGLLLTLNYRGTGSSIQQQFLIDVYAGHYEKEFGEDAFINGEGGSNLLDDTFTKAQLRYRFQWDWLWLSSQLEWSVRGQYSDVALPSMEQISVSGPFAVRALETGFYSADNGVLSSFQWRLMNPGWLGDNVVSRAISKAIVPFVFYDVALFQRNELTRDESQINGSQAGEAGSVLVMDEELTASGFGFGFDFNVKLSSTLSVFGRVTVARTNKVEQRITETNAVNTTIDPAQQRSVYGEFNVRF